MRQTGIDFKMAPPGGHEPNLPIMAPNAIGDLALTPGTLTPGTLPSRPPRGHTNQRRLDPGVKIAKRGQGQWWNPDESGSGYNIDIRNGVLVMTVYSYQADGDAQWYLTRRHRY
jgi:hypothetical protein